MLKYFIGGIVLFIIIIFVYAIIKNKKIDKEIESKLFDLSNKNNLILEKGKDFDCLIKNNEGELLKILVCKIPPNSSVTINSRETICLRWGGARYGRSYPNQRYLNEVYNFLKVKDEVMKVLLLYKTTEKILKYLNESEIATVNEGDTTYDYKVVTFNNLDDNFLKLFERKKK